MIIQHNIMALNSYNRLSANNSSLSKNLEKLSSGYKINRAGDDAAGLAISEKMRAQITGLERAQQNAQDGVSLVQTAEGNLTEVHSMLNRMVDLATQSSNGTYDNTTDRANLQKEVQSLKDEINRIAESANFNGIKLLDGSLGATGGGGSVGGGSNLGAGAPGAINFETVTGKMTGGQSGATNNVSTLTAVGAGAANSTLTVSYTDNQGQAQTYTITLATAATGSAGAWAASVKEQIAADTSAAGEAFNALFDVSNTGVALAFTSKATGADAAQVGGVAVNAANIFGASVASGAKATATATQTAHDKGFQIDITSALAVGDKFTIGDMKFQIVTNANSAAADGYIAISAGGSQAESATNIVKALRENGVTSASNVDFNGAATAKINVSIDQISSVQKGNVGISSGSDGIQISNSKETGGTFTIGMTTSGATEATEHTFTLDYLDDNGKKQTFEVKYSVGVGETAAQTAAKLSTALQTNKDLAGKFDFTDSGAGITLTAKDGTSSKVKILSASTTDTQAGGASTVTGVTTVVAGKAAATEVNFNANPKAGDTITVDGKTYQFVDRLVDAKDLPEGTVGVVIGATADDSADALNKALKDSGVDYKYDATNHTFKFSGEGVSKGSTEGGLNLQIGDTADQRVTVQVEDMGVSALGLDQVDVSLEDKASDSIQMIKDAINTVSTQRAGLGAIQNRLEHTVNNLSTTTENMTAAEARIRDTDMAKEMMQFTKNNVLSQAAQAMLAQANQQPQQVLQLLR